MTALNWCEAVELRLTDKLIQNPNSSSDLLQNLHNVRVAVDGAFLHIDARPTTEQRLPSETEYTVHVVPATAVEVIRYRETEPVKKPMRAAGF